MTNITQVGVGIYICHAGKLLTFQRLGKHGTGTWAAMGGHLEFGEHWFDTAMREAQEETGLVVHSPKLIGVTNDVFAQTGKHYVTFQVEVLADTPNFMNAEPEKHAHMDWRKWHEIPQPHFVSLAMMFEQNLKPSYLD
jgi:8-oxo-dGTP diphosphatase